LMHSTLNRRNIGVDIARIAACIAVVGLHTLQREVSYVNATLYYLCGFAVPVFFMCSGYMLIGRNTGYGYSIRKCLLLFFMLIRWGIIVYGCKYIYQFIIQGGDVDFSIKRFIVDILKGGFQSGYLWQFWYLAALMFVYLMLPIVNVFIKKRESVSIKRLVALWVLFVLISLAIQFTSYVCSRPIQKQFNQTLRVWTWMQYFLLGGIAKHVGMTLKGRKLACYAVITSVLIAIAQNFLGRNVLHDLHAEYFYDSALMIVWVYILFFCALNIRINPEKRPLVYKLSAYTLGVYIIHPLFMRIVSYFDFSFSIIGGIVYWFFMTGGCFGLVHVAYSNGFLRRFISLK